MKNLDKTKLVKATAGFKDKNILVVGDLMMDKFISGKVRRISPEAPVPVVEVVSENYMPGGAGNVALNILKLGAKVSLIGVVGNDFYGESLLELLTDAGAEVSGVSVTEGRPTSVKTRIIAENQQVVRFDREVPGEISSHLTDQLSSKAREAVSKADGVVVPDYGKGLITSQLIATLLEAAEDKGIPVIVDPQIGHFFEYCRVSSLTPNQKEAGDALKIEITDKKSLLDAGHKLIKKLQSKTLLITRGEEGMSLFYASGEVKHIASRAREVFDVTGAGDTVSSVFTLGLACGLEYYEAAVMANYAAAVVVGKLGTASITRQELIREIEEEEC
ncbi:MAG: D-glycero-beta-D-manno-heptose-7-phosphate kinase [Elusimicrobia bacterium]|nr:D-glycero-beta-D-manno-heptose-7-phosphate kinase [Elusimicrobiota bacterium]